MKVGQLLIGLGIQTDRRSFRAAEGAIGSMRRSMAGAAIGMAAYFGMKGLGKALIGFNMKVEDSKNQITGMLALGRKTGFNEQLKEAGELYDGLRKKAAMLPGETQDYVDVLGRLVQPMARAGASIGEMQEMTVSLYSAAKGLGEPIQAATRDLGEYINFGKWGTVDKFLNTILGPNLKDGGSKDERSERKNVWTRQQRMAEVQKALKAKALQDLIDVQSNSFSGNVGKLKDRLTQFLGKVGEGLFKALKPIMVNLDAWLAKNSVAVEAFAMKIGTGLVDAFNKLKDGVMWLVDHKDLVTTALWGIVGVFTALTLRAVIAWAAIAGPFILIGAVFGGLIKLFLKLEEAFGTLTAVIGTFMAAFAAYKILSAVGAIKAMTAALWGQARATAAVTAAQGAGGIAGAARTSGLASAAVAGGTMLGGFGAPVAKGPGGTMLGVGVPAIAAAPAAAGAGKRGLMAAAKGMGTALAAAAGPIGWTILGAKMLSDLTGGDFIDQANAKGYTGDNLYEAMQFLGKVGPTNSGGGNVTNVTVNVAPTNVEVTTKDADGTAAALEDAFVRKLDEAARVAGRNLGGNK